jgi:hypothetical protein
LRIELPVSISDAVISRVEQAEEKRHCEEHAKAIYGLADVRSDPGAQSFQSTHGGYSTCSHCRVLEVRPPVDAALGCPDT